MDGVGLARKRSNGWVFLGIAERERG